MTAAGLGLNEFCYAGLIVAHKNKKPLPDDFAAKAVIISIFLFGMGVCCNCPVMFKLIILCGKRLLSLWRDQRCGLQLKPTVPMLRM